jgi:transglutaminase-like putative cysteine protease
VHVNRRNFIRLLGAGSAAALVSPRALAALDDLGAWNSYRLSYHIELPESPAPARLWIPIPLLGDSIYQRNQGTIWSGNAQKVDFDPLKATAVPMVYAEWTRPGPRTLEVSTIVKTLDRKADLGKAAGAGPLPAETRVFLAGTSLIPVDHDTRKLAKEATQGAGSPLERARALYDWVIANAAYDPQVPGCGTGNVAAMLKSGKLAGRSADLSALLVALARASGIPARLAFGIALDRSRLSPALGAYGDVSQGQEVRAELYLAGAGWVPVDPANVVRAAFESGLPQGDPRIVDLKNRFFGGWEMNWVVLNHWERLSLKPQPAALGLPYFAYPHAEIAAKPRDSLDHRNFVYTVRSAQLVGTGARFDGIPGVMKVR